MLHGVGPINYTSMTLFRNPEYIESVLTLLLHHLATQVSVNLMIARGPDGHLICSENNL